MPEVPLATCQKDLSVDSTQVCAGAELGKDACSGDSGGGLFISDTANTWHLMGIVSYGALDCGNGIPGVYTRFHSIDIYIPLTGVHGYFVRVASFLDWIYAAKAAMI